MDAAALILIGIIVSGIVQFAKKKFGTSEGVTIGVTVGLAVVGAALYHGLEITGYLPVFYTVLTTAGAFYAFIVRTVEKRIQ